MRRWKLSKLVRITDDTHAHVWPSRKSSSCKKMMMNLEFTPLFLARLIFAFIACSVCSFKEHLQRVNFIYHSRLKDSPSWSDSVLRIAGECSLCPWRESFFSGLLTLFSLIAFGHFQCLYEFSSVLVDGFLELFILRPFLRLLRLFFRETTHSGLSESQ